MLTARVHFLRNARFQKPEWTPVNVVINWYEFEHQKGAFIMGETKKRFIRNKAMDASPAWQHDQTCWLKNLECHMQTIRLVTGKELERLNITGLVEDGLWEDRMWLPVALFAESLWNPHQSATELIACVAMAKDVHYAYHYDS
jgi:hypothetical protein